MLPVLFSSAVRRPRPERRCDIRPSQRTAGRSRCQAAEISFRVFRSGSRATVVLQTGQCHSSTGGSLPNRWTEWNFNRSCLQTCLGAISHTSPPPAGALRLDNVAHRTCLTLGGPTFCVPPSRAALRASDSPKGTEPGRRAAENASLDRETPARENESRTGWPLSAKPRTRRSGLRRTRTTIGRPWGLGAPAPLVRLAKPQCKQHATQHGIDMRKSNMLQQLDF